MTLVARTLILTSFVLLPAFASAQDPHEGHQPAPTPKPAPSKASPATAVEADHSTHGAAPEGLREPIPPITDADRAAAFPEGLEGHATHERQIHTFVLFDKLEWRGGNGGGVSLENKSWIGGDLNRLWVRAEGESERGRLETAHAHVLYGRSFSRWWDVVAGLRQDVEPGPSQTWAAIGVQGLAPQWFEVEATAYVGRGGRTQARFEVEYELLVTQKLVLQPLVEAEIYGKGDPLRHVGAGLSSVETGLRLRYEIRRELAPYVGITWERKFFGTADLARERGEHIGKAWFAFGVRTWF